MAFITGVVMSARLPMFPAVMVPLALSPFWGTPIDFIHPELSRLSCYVDRQTAFAKSHPLHNCTHYRCVHLRPGSPLRSNCNQNCLVTCITKNAYHQCKKENFDSRHYRIYFKPLRRHLFGNGCGGNACLFSVFSKYQKCPQAWHL